MRWISDDEAQFSSGHTLYANRRIIGICDRLELSEGYDGGINRRSLNDEDLHELADYMIGQWTQFKAKIGEPHE